MLKDIKAKFAAFAQSEKPKPVLMSSGRCPTCLADTTFVALDSWLRDHFRCSNCGSIPRERALMTVLETWLPHWRELVIHESSPCDRGASARIGKENPHYIPSGFFPGKEAGSIVAVPAYSRRTMRCENLEALSFADASIDVHITQDVLEHVYRPAQVFREIARSLKPGGAHIFTVPLGRKQQPSVPRARVGASGEIVHLLPPVYHSSTTTPEDALVINDWGYDICRYIFEACGLFTYLVYINDLSRGIRAELIEVLVTVKPASEATGLGAVPISS